MFCVFMCIRIGVVGDLCSNNEEGLCGVGIVSYDVYVVFGILDFGWIWGGIWSFGSLVCMYVVF